MSKVKGYWEDSTKPDEAWLPDFQQEPDYLPDEVPQEFPVRASDEYDELPF